MAVFDFDEALEQYHSAMTEFVKGNAESLKKLFSHRDDVTVSGGFGGYFRGREQVEGNTEMAASRFVDRVVTGFENVTKYATPELGYTVDVERLSAKLADGRTWSRRPCASRASFAGKREAGT